MVRRGSSETEARGGFQSMRSQFDQAQDVPGLGGTAFTIGDQLHVLQGSVQLTISGDVAAATAQDLARTALSRARPCGGSAARRPGARAGP